jgi:DNA-binding beta-propeller fold protein YncE
MRVVCLDLATRDTVWVSTDTNFEYPVGCALSADGATLFVTDGDDKRVVALCAASGAHLGAFGQCGSAPDEFQYAIGIAVVPPSSSASSAAAAASGSGSDDAGASSGQQHAWVADNGNNRVAVFDTGASAAASAWTAVAQIEHLGSKEGEEAEAATLGEPFGVCFSSDGRLALVSVPQAHAIHVFDAATRAFVRTIGTVQSVIRIGRQSVAHAMPAMLSPEQSDSRE